VRIGSISQGKNICDACGKVIPYAGRYIIVKETDGVEDEATGQPRHYCVKCATEKGYAHYRAEKNEGITTFFQEMIAPVAPIPEPGAAETAETEEAGEKQNE